MFTQLSLYTSRILKNQKRMNINIYLLALAFTCAISIAAGKGDIERISAAIAAGKEKDMPEPVLLKDINPGDGSSSPEMFVEFNGAVFFRANDGTHGSEVWRTDGTPEGTRLLSDLYPGAANARPDNLAVAGGSLYFNAFTEEAGSKVFKSDGTAAGTVLLIDTNPGAPAGINQPLPSLFTTYGELVLFAAADSEAGYELWRTDGTNGGTFRVKDIHPGMQWSIPVSLTPFDGRIFFAADDKVTIISDGIGFFDRELFATDGTDAGTFRVKDIFPGPRPSIPFNFTVFRKQLFFTADDGTSGNELWVTDGTEGGTRLFKDINPAGRSDPMSLTVVGPRRLLFTADDGTTGREMWVSDGREAGTHLIREIIPNTSSSLPLNLTALGNQVFFTADGGQHGTELWLTDGTAAGTYLVKDINPGIEGSSPLNLLAAGAVLFFTASIPDSAAETFVTQLWLTDGTEKGSKLVWQAPGKGFGSIQNLTLLDAQLLFSAPSGVDAEGNGINTELYSLALPRRMIRGQVGRE
jgi:ELWxxDGT repeat protein